MHKVLLGGLNLSAKPLDETLNSLIPIKMTGVRIGLHMKDGKYFEGLFGDYSRTEKGAFLVLNQGDQFASALIDAEQILALLVLGQERSQEQLLCEEFAQTPKRVLEQLRNFSAYLSNLVSGKIVMTLKSTDSLYSKETCENASRYFILTFKAICEYAKTQEGAEILAERPPEFNFIPAAFSEIKIKNNSFTIFATITVTPEPVDEVNDFKNVLESYHLQ